MIDPRSPLEVWLDEKNITANFCNWFRTLQLEHPTTFGRTWAVASINTLGLVCDDPEVLSDIATVNQLRGF